MHRPPCHCTDQRARYEQCKQTTRQQRCEFLTVCLRGPLVLQRGRYVLPALLSNLVFEMIDTQRN